MSREPAWKKVECPACGAKPSDYCTTINTRLRLNSPHAARLRTLEHSRETPDEAEARARRLAVQCGLSAEDTEREAKAARLRTATSPAPSGEKDKP